MPYPPLSSLPHPPYGLEWVLVRFLPVILFVYFFGCRRHNLRARQKLCFFFLFSFFFVVFFFLFSPHHLPTPLGRTSFSLSSLLLYLHLRTTTRVLKEKEKGKNLHCRTLTATFTTEPFFTTVSPALFLPLSITVYYAF